MEKWLSIIVPIYNTDKYLKKCVNSLINQNTDEYEIILINDGSSDKSDIICTDYAKKHKELIKYIKKENSGLSDTRNSGIKKSKGKYICFVDSDDYIEDNCLKSFKEILKEGNIDILFYGYILENSNENPQKKFTYKSRNDRMYDTDIFLTNELNKRNIPIPACFAFYRKDIITKNKIFFEPGILHEDERWSPQIILNSKKVYLSSKCIYHYVQRENSITHKKDKTQNGIDIINTCVFLDKKSNNIKNKKIKKLMKNRIAMLYMKGMVIGKLCRKQYSKYINRFFPINHATKLIDKIKSIIFLVSPYWYYKIYYSIKNGEK